MKSKKTNHFQEDADKIEQVPEEKNNGHDKPIKARKPKKNRFLACLRKAWARITGCLRCCCTSIQEERSAEELPGPSNNMGELSGHSDINMEELQNRCGMIMEELQSPCGSNMEDLQSPCGMIIEELQSPCGINLEELQSLCGINMEELKNRCGMIMEELQSPCSITMEELQSPCDMLMDELQSPCGINMEELQSPCGMIMEELQSPCGINMEDLQSPCGMIMEELQSPCGIIMEEFQSPCGINMEELQSPCGIIMEEFQSPCGINMEDLQSPCGMIMEELQSPCGINMDERQTPIKNILFTAKESAEIKEENMEVNQNMKTDNEKAEVVVTNSLVEKEKEANYQSAHSQIHSQEYLYFLNYSSQEPEVVTYNFVEKNAEHQCLFDLIHNQEDLCVMNYTSQEEILADYYHIHDQMQITEDLHIQDYDAQYEEQHDGEKLECKVEENTEIKIKEDGLEKADNTKESQTDNESSKDKKNKGKDNSINIKKEGQECRSKQMSSSKSSSLEKEKPEELYKSIETSQSGSSHYEEPSTSDIRLEKLEQSYEETPSTVPLTLDSFTLHDKLGEGSFGAVLLATDIIREECVALKVLNKSLFKDCEESFTEHNILKLTHKSPFLIHGLAAFHTEKCVYYVLELAPKGNLFDFIINNYPLDTPTIQFIIAELICGAEFLHKNNIIHRDLKPANIVLTADCHIKIADFGLALMGVDERTTEKARGTPQYRAPEMWRKEEYGRGIDYFAIGVIMYRLYANQHPFPGKTVKEVCYSILNHNPHYPESLTPETVAMLQGLLYKYPDYRLGVLGNIKKHPFFSGINWEDVESRRMEPPEAMETADYVYLDMDENLDYGEKQIDIESEDQKIFKNLSFVCPDWSQHYHPINNENI